MKCRAVHWSSVSLRLIWVHFSLPKCSAVSLFVWMATLWHLTLLDQWGGGQLSAVASFTDSNGIVHQQKWPQPMNWSANDNHHLQQTFIMTANRFSHLVIHKQTNATYILLISHTSSYYINLFSLVSDSPVSIENIIYETFVVMGELRWYFSALIVWRTGKLGQVFSA